MSDPFLATPEPKTITTASAPLLARGGEVSLSVNRISTVVEAVAPANLVITSKANTLVISAPGPAGATGPQGPQGPNSGDLSHLDDLIDVLTVSPADGDLLKYSGSLNTWTNSNRLDGGNF